MRGIKNELKAIVGLAAILVAVAALSYFFRKPASVTKRAQDVAPLELDALYEEEGGYHIPGLPWGMCAKEVEQTIGASLGPASEGTQQTYYLENADVEKIGDYVTSKVDYVFSPGDELTSVVYNFDKESYQPKELDAIYEELTGRLTELYGEPTGVTESQPGITKTNYYGKTYRWDRGLADGRTTSLQVVKVDTGSGTVNVGLGTVIFEAEDEAESETEGAQYVSD